MSGGGTTTSQTINKTEIPQWISDAGKSNYAEAVRIGAKPLNQFQGSTVADVVPSMQEALSYIKGGVAAGNPYTDAAGSIFSRMGDAASMNSGVTAYMNPEIDNVEKKALGALEDQRVQSVMSNADRAVKSKAFGGTRSAIVDAVTNTETAKEAGLLSAQLRKTAFDDAVGRQRSDLTTAGQGLLSTGDQKTSDFMKNISALLQGGQVEQTNAQAKRDAEVAKFREAQDKDTTALNLRMSALGMTPYPTSSSATTTTKQPSTFDPASLLLGILSLGMGAI